MKGSCLTRHKKTTPGTPLAKYEQSETLVAFWTKLYL